MNREITFSPSKSPDSDINTEEMNEELKPIEDYKEEEEKEESSKAYEIYKESVGGKTWNGENMKLYSELPNNIKKGWSDIDKYYNDCLTNFINQFLKTVVESVKKDNIETLERVKDLPESVIDGNLIFK